MEKYSRLNSGIDETRQKLSSIEEEKDLLNAKIEIMRQERSRMEASVEASNVESADFQERIKNVAQEGSLQQQAPVVNFWKEFVMQQRQDFLERSRQFRRDIKRLKMSNPECGLAALMEVNNSSSSDTNPIVLDERTTEELQAEWHLLALETDEKLESEQHLIQARQAYKRAFLAKDRAQLYLSKAEEELDVVQQQSDKRNYRRQQLQAQLDRVCKDVRALEVEIAEIEEQTQETQALTESYRQRCLTRNRQVQQAATNRSSAARASRASGTSGPAVVSATSSRRAVGNPYANKNNRSTSSSKRNKSRPKTVTPPPAPRTTLERQHPHLAGRIRMDRQFGGAAAAFGIIGGAEVEEERPRPLTLPNALEFDDDSSDDDEITSFVAFSKK